MADRPGPMVAVESRLPPAEIIDRASAASATHTAARKERGLFRALLDETPHDHGPTGYVDGDGTPSGSTSGCAIPASARGSPPTCASLSRHRTGAATRAATRGPGTRLSLQSRLAPGAMALFLGMAGVGLPGLLGLAYAMMLSERHRLRFDVRTLWDFMNHRAGTERE